MDDFERLSVIGSGSFGIVYKAREKRTNSIVALKVIDKNSYKPKELKNFQKECSIQRQLRHPNIIRLLGSVETTDEIGLITECADIDLNKLMRGIRKFDEDKVKQLTCDLISALHYLHSNCILHRDIKPENILLDKDVTRARLCDFGLARMMTNKTYYLMSMKGTPLYMAPEVSRGPYDHKADFWSIGCVVYQMLVGKPPYKAKTFCDLVKIQENAEINWPLGVSADCLSFLMGLLKKKPEDRSTWKEILAQPFVKGHILMDNDNMNEIPFTKQLDENQIREKERQRVEIQEHIERRKVATVPKLFKLAPVGHHAAADLQMKKFHDVTTDDNATASSMDSIQNIVQTDLENIDTDIEELCKTDNIPMGKKRYGTRTSPRTPADVFMQDACYNIADNMNLVVQRYQDNFDMPHDDGCTNAPIIEYGSTEEPDAYEQNATSRDSNYQNSVERLAKGCEKMTPSNLSKCKNKELEKRKLNQNLDNFSVRLNNNALLVDKEPVGVQVISNAAASKDSTTSIIQDADSKLKKAPTNPPAIDTKLDDCSGDYQSPPIENEEWLDFLRKTMHEVLEGEFESLKQQTLVGIIVAILRNVSASCKVLETVAQLLSLPLILPKANNDINEIKNVYIQAKLVPNLVFASKLICSIEPIRSLSSTASSINAASNDKPSVYRPINDITTDELTTLASMYELTCHLVHLNGQFLSQFCDSVEIIAHDLLIHFLSNVTDHPMNVRLIGSVLALLCCAIQELPENAGLVENIIFHKRVNLTDLLSSNSIILKIRACMLLRVIGRYSCVALENVWTSDVRDMLETLTSDSSPAVRDNAEEVIEELREFYFYNRN